MRTQPGHLVDIMATVVDVGGATYPKQDNGHVIQPMEGRSLRPAFANQPIQREALYWEHEGNAAVRVGDWKLVRKGANGPWEFYNLKTDRTEMHDLATTEPERVKELTGMWQAWAARAQVLPAPGQAQEAKKTPAKKNAGKKTGTKKNKKKADKSNP